MNTTESLILPQNNFKERAVAQYSNCLLQIVILIYNIRVIAMQGQQKAANMETAVANSVQTSASSR